MAGVAGAVSSTELMKGLIEAGGSLEKVVGKFKEILLDPIIKEVKEHTKRINTNIEGIREDEKKVVNEALRTLESVTVTATMIRIVLTELAKTTINQSETIRLIMTKISPEDPDKVAINKLLFLSKYMTVLLQTSSKSLADAKFKYEKALQDMAKVKADLEAFKKHTLDIADQEGDRFKAWAKQKRIEVYASVAITGPVGLAIAAAILETKINEYKGATEALVRQANDAAANADAALKDSIKCMKSMTEEVGIVMEWEGKIKVLSIPFENATSLEMAISVGLKDQIIVQMKSLEATCKHYIDTVKPSLEAVEKHMAAAATHYSMSYDLSVM